MSISVTKEMQQEGARLKLLSVLKVAEKKPLTNEAPKEETPAPKPSSAALQLKQMLLKGGTSSAPEEKLSKVENPSPTKTRTSKKTPKNTPKKVAEVPKESTPLSPAKESIILEAASLPKLAETVESLQLASPTKAADPATIAAPQIDNQEMKKDSNEIITQSATTAVLTTTATTAPPRRRLFFIRTPSSCKGTVELTYRPHKASQDEMRVTEDFKLRPGAPLACHWKLPINLFETTAATPPVQSTPAPPGLTQLPPIPPPPQKMLMLGLYRFGCHSNKDGSIISKPIEEFTDTPTHRQGIMKFFCPKSAGVYIFRLYDANATEGQYETLAVSARIMITLYEQDIESNLQFVIAALQEENFFKGIGLLSVILPYMRNNNNKDNNRQQFNNNNNAMLNGIINDLNYCVTEMLNLIDDSLDIVEEGQFKKQTVTHKADGEAKKEGADTTKGGAGNFEDQGKDDNIAVEDPAEAEFWKKYRNSMKLHYEIQETLSLLQRSKTPWYWIAEKLKLRIRQRLALYCPILRRFFKSTSDFHQTRLRVLEFCPSGTGIVGEGERAISASPDQQLAKTMSLALNKVTEPLITDGLFEKQRMDLCQKLEDLLRKEGFCQGKKTSIGTTDNETAESKSSSNSSSPSHFHLAVYGSSRNGFGNRASDIDICLAIPPSLFNDSITKLKTMLELEEKLTAIGMKDVKSLLTARVPIVEFVDPDSGASCDISLQNELAVANTEMLRLYSQIDNRVRQLAYLVKAWAKARDINTPQQGTLGSYAYVITVLHFLQNRPKPIIPVLQLLKTDAATGEILTVNESDGLEEWVTNPTDGTRCNVYFFKPNANQLKRLKDEAKKNTETISELFLEYLKYFCYSIDPRNQVISIRKGTRGQSSLVSKQDKYEYYCWTHTDLLSVEDPFEIHYDVAHVLRPHTMASIRKEFIRAYTILSRCIIPVQQLKRVEPMLQDFIPYALSAEKAIELLFEPVPNNSSSNNN